MRVHGRHFTHLSLVLATLLCSASPIGAQGGAEPLSLTAALQEALDHNPGVQALRHRVQASEKGIEQARSMFYPRLDFEEVFTNGDDPVYVFGSLLRQGDFGQRNFDPALLNNPSPLNNFNHRLVLSQLIYDGGRRESGVSAAGKELEVAQQRRRGAEQRLLFDVFRQYYGVLVSEQAWRVSEESLKAAEADLKAMTDRHEVGVAVKSDVMRLEVQVADYRRAVLAAESEARIARQELEMTLGRRPEGTVRLSDTLEERVFSAGSLDTLENTALEQRADLRQATLGVEMAGDNRLMKRSGILPTIGFLGSYDFNHGSSTGLGNQYLVAVQLKFNLFDAGSKSAAVEQARAEQLAQDRERYRTEQQVLLDVRRANERQRVALEQYQVAKQSVVWAEESLRIVRERQAEGLATVTDLLLSQSAWHGARQSALQALYRYYVEYAALELAAGTLSQQSQIFSK